LGRKAAFVDAIPGFDAELDQEEPGEGTNKPCIWKSDSRNVRRIHIDGWNAGCLGGDCRLLPSAQYGSQENGANADGAENKVPRAIMPQFHGGESLIGRDPNEEKGAGEVRANREDKRAEDQPNPPGDGQSRQIAEEQPNHQRGLERTDATAGFVDTNHSGINSNEIALELRGNPTERRDFARSHSHPSHQKLDQRHLDDQQPGNRDEKKGERKSEMADPRFSTREPKAEQAEDGCHQSVEPAEKAPVGIGHLE
jgi:hypothetical protein